MHLHLSLTRQGAFDTIVADKNEFMGETKWTAGNFFWA
jgi:hypothetical protein